MAAIDDQKAVQAMMEEQRTVQSIHERRLTIVEQEISSQNMRLGYVENRQTKLETAMSNQAEAITTLANKATLHDAMIDQLKQGNELHARTMQEMNQKHGDELKDLTKEQVRQDKLIQGISDKVAVIWRTIATIGGTVALILLEYLFTRILPK